MRALLLLAMALAAPCLAQPALVADVTPGSGSGNVEELATVGGRLYFSATDGVRGSELWEYDPATGILTFAAEVFPGSSSSHPRFTTPLGDDLYFEADDGVTGRELWHYGPATGTADLAADVRPDDAEGTGPRYMAAYDGRLYFRAYTTTSGKEVWRHDPADGSTVQVDGDLPRLDVGEPDLPHRLRREALLPCPQPRYRERVLALRRGDGRDRTRRRHLRGATRAASRRT